MSAVVLVHGWGGSGASFGAVRAALEHRGHRVLSPDLRPADGSRSLTELAGRLAARLEAGLEPSERFYLVGFSMGGLIARLYAQHPRHAASGQPAGLLALRPGSRLLLELARGEAALEGVPVLTLWTPFNLMVLMVLPAPSARWPGRFKRELLAPLHGRLLRDARLIDALQRHLARAEARRRVA